MNGWKKAENVHCIFDLLQPKSDPSSFPEPEFRSYVSQSNGREGHVKDELNHLYKQLGSSSEPMELDLDNSRCNYWIHVLFGAARFQSVRIRGEGVLLPDAQF